MAGQLGYRVPVLDRFFAKVEKHDDDCPCCDGCWHWTGMRLKGEKLLPYGYLWLEGKMVRAHRLAHELFIGPIPTGLLVLHSCDRPWCVNPEHLRAGTHSDNSRDCVSRGRHGNQWRSAVAA
jgi:hypothetical protein